MVPSDWQGTGRDCAAILGESYRNIRRYVLQFNLGKVGHRRYDLQTLVKLKVIMSLLSWGIRIRKVKSILVMLDKENGNCCIFSQPPVSITLDIEQIRNQLASYMSRKGML